MATPLVTAQSAPNPAEDCGCGTGASAEGTEPPIACTLGAQDAVDRMSDWHEATAEALTHTMHTTGVRLVFEPSVAVASRLASLAAAETQCCAFFRMTLTLAADELLLDIECPASAMPILEELLAP